MGFTPTAEQERCIEVFDRGRGENMVIDAGAGAAKTTTLKLLSQNAGPNVKGVYIAYNKAIQLEAEASFPNNTRCKTAHSFAFGPVGSKYKHRIGRDAPYVPSNTAAKILGIKNGIEVNEEVYLSPGTQAVLARQTCLRFCYSADRQLGLHHVPYIPMTSDAQMEYLRPMILRNAQKTWEDAQNVKGRLRFEHDYYLKMWALTDPILPGKFILFDEAQDANPCVAGLVLNQDAQLIAVGDRNQAIYGWRGASDAMENWPAKHRLSLSKSFRFGQAVADEANKWLELLEAELRITGFEQINSVVGAVEKPKAILCRTNAGTISAAMQAGLNGQSYAIVGGTEDIKRFADAAEQLQANQQPTEHPELAAFKNWGELKKFVEEEGGDLKTFVNMVDDFGVQKIREVAERSLPPKREKQADVVVSTAHKSKGREWHSVKIGDDFQPPEDGEEKFSRPEAMLAYVAVTRAQQQLDKEGLNWVDKILELRKGRPDSRTIEQKAQDGEFPQPEEPVNPYVRKVRSRKRRKEKTQ